MVDPPSPGGRSNRAQGERSMSEERSIQDGPRSGKAGARPQQRATWPMLTYNVPPLLSFLWASGAVPSTPR